MGRKLCLLLLITMLISSLSPFALAAPEDASASQMETVVLGNTTSADDGDSAAEEDNSDEEALLNYQGVTDVEYSGPLDPLTGMPATSEQDGEDSSYVTLQENYYGYDKDLRCYINHVGSHTFQSSIPPGAFLSSGMQTVSFTIPSGLNAALYRNGEHLPDANLEEITEPGSYVLNVSVSNSSDTVPFSFRLLDEITNAVTEFSLPAGFVFDSVTINNESVVTDYTNYTQLIENGPYKILWSCSDIDQHYTTSFTLDTEAPTLALPEVTDGEAHSAVTLTDLESGASILLENKKTGETKTISSPTASIKDAGTYHLVVSDQAGNSNTYDFTIHVYLNISAIAAIAMILATILGLRLYCRYIRKHPRVG